MNIIQSKEDTVKCLSFFRTTAAPELHTVLNEIVSASYLDQDAQEDMFSISIFEDLHEQELTEITLTQLAKIKQLMDRQNASYFRFID